MTTTVCLQGSAHRGINSSTYGADALVPVVAQYVALNKLHSMHISSYMQVLDKQSEE